MSTDIKFTVKPTPVKLMSNRCKAKNYRSFRYISEKQRRRGSLEPYWSLVRRDIQLLYEI